MQHRENNMFGDLSNLSSELLSKANGLKHLLYFVSRDETDIEPNQVLPGLLDSFYYLSKDLCDIAEELDSRVGKIGCVLDDLHGK